MGNGLRAAKRRGLLSHVRRESDVLMTDDDLADEAATRAASNAWRLSLRPLYCLLAQVLGRTARSLTKHGMQTVSGSGASWHPVASLALSNDSCSSCSQAISGPMHLPAQAANCKQTA